MPKARILCLVVALAALMTSQLYAGVGILKADTYVSLTNSSTNFGSATLMNVGAGNAGLLQFDLSQVLSQLVSSIPSSTTPIIGKATLTVFVNRAALSGTLEASPLLNSWSETTVTHSSLPPIGAVAGSTAVSTSGQFVSIDITPIVQGWLSNNDDTTSSSYVGGDNFGLYLNSPDGGVFVLDTKEGTTTSHAAALDIDLASNFSGVLRKVIPPDGALGFVPLMSIHLTGSNTAGGRIYYTIRATDGGSQIATEEGILQFLATTNSITCNITADDKLHLGTVNSGCNPTFTNPSLLPGIGIYDEVSFPTPAPIVAHEIFYRIENLSDAVIRLEP